MEPCRLIASNFTNSQTPLLLYQILRRPPNGKAHLPMFLKPAENPASFGGLKQLYSQYLLRYIMYYLLGYLDYLVRLSTIRIRHS